MSVNSPPSLGEETLLLIQSEFRLHRAAGAVGDFELDLDGLACNTVTMNSSLFFRTSEEIKCFNI